MNGTKRANEILQKDGVKFVVEVNVSELDNAVKEAIQLTKEIEEKQSNLRNLLYGILCMKLPGKVGTEE